MKEKKGLAQPHDEATTMFFFKERDITVIHKPLKDCCQREREREVTEERRLKTEAEVFGRVIFERAVGRISTTRGMFWSER